ncbi:UDP-N-acetylmuramoyl-L-alanine--D-glutamate ligase [Candidatus Dojkabacteria bacterium]|nr:UDP-N-acetylmuramoyl-L-alanine--D-glutamate ligase [Candidatus Dojkabacteria bacterium]
MQLSDFKNKKVLIFGLGLNDGGVGMVDFFIEAGAQVTITDGKTEQDLTPSLAKLKKYGDKITYHLGENPKQDFLDNDIIIRNPAIKPGNELIEIAKNAGKMIEMEMSLFHKLAPCPIIGITGTRGKSTTTTLIYKFLEKKYGDKVLLAGNIGKSAIRELKNLTKENLAVLEISSFQLDAMGQSKVSPMTAVVTNIYPDHLNWHADMDDYINAKKNIFKFQSKDDYCVINLDNEITRNFSDEVSSHLITFSLKNNKADFYCDDELNVYHGSQKSGINLGKAKLEGEHNLYNMLCAIATVSFHGVEILEDEGKNIVNEILNEFSGVEGRQELIRELNGVKYYNDTCATTLEAMIVALKRFGPKFPKKIIMIAGGVDKGLDYSSLVPLFNEYLKGLVLLEGTASEKISQALDDSEVKNIEISKYFGNFEEAVKKASSMAENGDMIILCPGGSSFNMFQNEFDRGAQFNKFVNNL